ncbi:MAG: prenyltransferase/squalene oxidase repeat-containing protein [Candidatus Helarchaeota archaeon]
MRKSKKKIKEKIIGILIFLLLFNIQTIPITLNDLDRNFVSIFLYQRQILNASDIINFGGFEDYANEGKSYLETSLYAVELLITLDNIQIIDKDAIIEYLVAHQLSDGGYGPEIGMNITYMKSTAEAVQMLFLLNQTEWIDQNVTNWIKNRQLLNPQDTINYGGFEQKEDDGLSTLRTTYYAINLMNKLQKLEEINITAVLLWMKKLQMQDGSFVNFQGSTANIEYTSLAIQTLRLLNSLYIINHTRTTEYLISKQNINNTDGKNFGGFSDNPELAPSQLKETYYAIKALKDLNQLNKINRTICINFLLQFQNFDGGFYMPPTNISTVSATFYVISTLKLLNYEFDEDNSNTSKGSEFQLVIILLIIIVPISGAFLYFKGKTIIKIMKRKKKLKSKLSKKKLINILSFNKYH